MFPSIEQMNATARQYEREAMAVRAERDARHMVEAEAARERRPFRPTMPALHMPRFWSRKVSRRRVVA